MSKRKRKTRILILLLACALLAAVPADAVTLVSNTGFPDVPRDTWYEQALLQMQSYTPGIINGIVDGDGVTRFHPDDNVKRGEFLKMIMTAAWGYTADRSRDGIHWAGKYYTIAMENNILVADVYYSSAPIFDCTYAALEEPINRYEMAVILRNVCTNMQKESTVIATNAAQNITDYGTISAKYVTAVEQAYGKGLLTGYEDGSFQGNNRLKRSEAAVVIYRMLWNNERKMPGWAETPALTTAEEIVPQESFAFWMRDHMDGWGNLDREARLRIFGDENKTHFSNSTEAAPFMKSISVPIWEIKDGVKQSGTAYLTVHYLVADEVKLIFQQIYNDPEQFPIYGHSIGGARYSDTMRHSYGMAIDVNAYFNCECTINWNSMSNRVTCGYGWWPQGHANSAFKGSLTEQSIYSIGSQPGEYGYSVVKAFATYGWGWGGNGYSKHADGSQKFDYMHFSVMKAGG